MRLKQVFDLTDWKSVCEELCRCYPAYKKRLELLELFERTYAHVKSLPTAESELTIYVEAYPGAETSESSEIAVCGRDGSFFDHQDHLPVNERVEARFNLSFTKWEEWLGMEVSEETLRDYRPPEVAAHCLREMTFYGFSQDVIQQRFAGLLEQVEEIGTRNNGQG